MDLKSLFHGASFVCHGDIIGGKSRRPFKWSFLHQWLCQMSCNMFTPSSNANNTTTSSNITFRSTFSTTILFVHSHSWGYPPYSLPSLTTATTTLNFRLWDWDSLFFFLFFNFFFFLICEGERGECRRRKLAATPWRWRTSMAVLFPLISLYLLLLACKHHPFIVLSLVFNPWF